MERISNSNLKYKFNEGMNQNIHDFIDQMKLEFLHDNCHDLINYNHHDYVYGEPIEEETFNVADQTPEMVLAELNENTTTGKNFVMRGIRSVKAENKVLEDYRRNLAQNFSQYTIEYNKRKANRDNLLKEFNEKQNRCSKIFLKYLGELPLLKIKPFLEQRLFRRAWIELNYHYQLGGINEGNRQSLASIQLTTIKFESSHNGFAKFFTTMDRIYTNYGLAFGHELTDGNKKHFLLNA